MELPGLLCERLEAVQLECCMAGQGCWVASVEDRGPHELLPRRLEIVQDHDVEAPGLPSPCSDLRSNRMLIEAEITQLDSGGTPRCCVVSWHKSDEASEIAYMHELCGCAPHRAATREICG